MKYFIYAILFSLPLLSFANYGELRGCGEYEISGTVKKDEKDILKILVHEGTKSEYKILISSNEWASVAGFINRDVIFNGEIDFIDGTRLHGTRLVEFKNRVSNPLEMKGSTGFKLIKSKECVK
jgi:hypothetical protein